MNTSNTFVFFGIVGSGKGTQVELLDQYIKENNLSSDIVFNSTGNLYRGIIGSGSLTGNIVKSTLEKGFLQPDFLTISLFANVLIQNMKEDSILISDGFPRTIAQSEAFESAMNFYGRENIDIIYIELNKEDATARMKARGRSDDTDEGIAKRFDEYVNNVIPAMDYFKNKDNYKIHTINGNQSIEQVHKDIISSLGI